MSFRPPHRYLVWNVNPEVETTIFWQQDSLSGPSISKGTQMEVNGVLDRGGHPESAGLLGLPGSYALFTQRQRRCTLFQPTMSLEGHSFHQWKIICNNVHMNSCALWCRFRNWYLKHLLRPFLEHRFFIRVILILPHCPLECRWKLTCTVS